MQQHMMAHGGQGEITRRSEETVLRGGRTTPGVVRVGDTAHRPPNANSEPEAASDAERGGDMAMRQRPDDLKAFAGRQQLFVAQYRAQRGDLLGLPLAQIGESAVLDLAGFAVGLTQQNGRRRAPVWNDGHGT